MPSGALVVCIKQIADGPRHTETRTVLPARPDLCTHLPKCPQECGHSRLERPLHGGVTFSRTPWGSQSWLQPPFQAALISLFPPERPAESRLRAELPAP